MANVLEELRELVAENRVLKLSTITESTKFTDMGFDSIDKVEMIMQAEEKFNVKLENDIAVETVGELAKIIEEKKK